MIVPPGFSRPSRSAAAISPTAMRSLIDPPGLKVSTLATIRGRTSPSRRESRTSGVSPIVSRIDSFISPAVADAVAIAPPPPQYKPGLACPDLLDPLAVDLDLEALVRDAGALTGQCPVLDVSPEGADPSTSRSGKVRPVEVDAHAFWLRRPGRGEIRPLTLPEPGRDDVMVRTLRSGVSRGTEALVFRGGVPPGQYAAMRAPFQEGDFPGPVKYGCLNVGAVEQGPPELSGRTVFCLYPHQTAYVVPATAVSVVPEGVPPPRAVLAGTVETAVNALWDAAPLVGDRVAVVGAGMVGCCVAR